MNYETAIAAMRSYFDAEWNNATPVAYDDVPFTIPQNETWVRFNISHADGYQASIGSPASNRFRREGLIVAQVFQPQGQASKDARQKADLIVSAFLGVENSGIHYYDVQVREIGNDGAGYYQINVLIYFRYDHIA
jgi:hypothetical protein